MQRSQSWIIPTVMSPEKGGPVYNQLRANFAYTRTGSAEAFSSIHSVVVL